jgi:osmoprotectant transport system permease protein
MINSVLDFFRENSGQVGELTLDHLTLMGSALGLAVLIGVGSGIFASRRPGFARAALAIANVAQAVPSIAVLGLVVPLLGVGFLPALVALTLRAILPIYLNTHLGLSSLPDTLQDARRGLGMRERQSLMLVELPLASPVIMAGIRTAAVEGVGIATLAAFIGAGGLGDLILQGIAMMDPARLLGGALPAAGLAISIELLFASGEALLRRRLRH